MTANVSKRYRKPPRPVTPPHVSLRVLRKAVGLTLEELGERIKAHAPEFTVSRGTLSAIESGSRGVSPLMLRAIEKAYGLEEGEITLDYLPYRAKAPEAVA